MKNLHVVMLCCFSVVCVKTSSVLEVSGRVGGEVTIHCSVSRDSSSEHSDMYFCKGVCSRENVLIQTEGKRSRVTRWRRYTMDSSGGDGVFNVTIKKLRRADTGSYCCGAEKTFNVLQQKITLIVLDASTVPPGSLPTNTAVQTEAENLSRGSSHSSTQSPPPALTPPSTEQTSQQAAITLSDTTVVIIVSVSLALLVCALIPLVFYGNWRSNTGQSRPEANKAEDDCGDENSDGASDQHRVKLQTPEPDPESRSQDASQYAAIYQALDPKSLD